MEQVPMEIPPATTQMKTIQICVTPPWVARVSFALGARKLVEQHTSKQGDDVNMIARDCRKTKYKMQFRTVLYVLELK